MTTQNNVVNQLEWGKLDPMEKTQGAERSRTALRGKTR